MDVPTQAEIMHYGYSLVCHQKQSQQKARNFFRKRWRNQFFGAYKRDAVSKTLLAAIDYLNTHCKEEEVSKARIETRDHKF